MQLWLVEDDRTQAALYERAFGRVVDQVHVADGVAAATRLIELAAEDSIPDVVVIDVLLHDGSGFDVLEALRSHPGCETVPVVAWSASLRADHVEQRRGDERCLVVPKPIGIDELQTFASEVATVGELAAGATSSNPFRFDDLGFGGGSPVRR